MDNDQVAQRGDRHPDRQRQADDGDQRVRHQVADHRQQAEQEGQHDQGFGQRQLDAEHRQDHREEDPGEHGVEQGNLDLREDDIAKRLHQQMQTVEQSGGQRLALGHVGDALQGDDRAEHHADQQGDEHVRGVLADQLQVGQMLARPLADRHAKFRRAGRQIGIDERRQLPARAIDHTHEFIERGAGVFRFMQEETDGASEDQRQRTHHQRAEQRHRQPARTPPFDQPLQLRGEHVDQLEHQQPGQQARQQAQRQHQQQTAKNDDATDPEHNMTLRKRWHTASKRTA